MEAETSFCGEVADKRCLQILQAKAKDVPQEISAGEE